MLKKSVRIEEDVIGKKEVLSGAYYGVFTARARENFGGISGMRIKPELNRAIVEIKLCAAQANMDLKVLDKGVGKVIVKACRKILGNTEKYGGEFVVDVYQAGAGTPWHMNVNEVIANVGLELMGEKKGKYGKLDPHDNVNLSQSTNGVIPTAIRIACLRLCDELIEEIRDFIKILSGKGKQFMKLRKVGRTHLMDAVPITLGQEFGAWAADMKKRLKVLKIMEENLRYLPIGGTAVGTGFSAAKNFDNKVVDRLRRKTGLDLKVAENKIEETQFMTDFLDLSSALRSIAVDVGKIANDLRLLNSGPFAGLNEIKLPEVEAGSSIMPGKVNPSMAEMMNMVCLQVIGNDEVVREAASSGQLELNVMTPVLAYNLMQSLEILKNGLREFKVRCVSKIKANKKVMEAHLEKNPMVATALNKKIGYDKAAKIVKEAIRKEKSVKEIVVEKKIMSRKEAEKFFSLKNFV